MTKRTQKMSFGAKWVEIMTETGIMGVVIDFTFGL